MPFRGVRDNIHASPTFLRRVSNLVFIKIPEPHVQQRKGKRGGCGRGRRRRGLLVKRRGVLGVEIDGIGTGEGVDSRIGEIDARDEVMDKD
jgi:hypothetical protein